MTALRLRPLRVEDEAVVLAAHDAMAAEGFAFLLGYDGQPFADVVRLHHQAARGLDLGAGLVPATFLVAEVDGQVVGRASIRHELNEHLAREGGHIGYGVIAEHRRRGCATEILRQALVVARSLGVDRALLTCDDHNVGSIRAIEANGGALQDVIDVSGSRLRRYWIDGAGSGNSLGAATGHGYRRRHDPA